MYSVYEITNQINGKKYVGITSRSIEERFEDHKSRARCYQRGNRLYSAMRKYGVDNFTVSLIVQVDNEDDVRELETQHIKQLDSYKNGYNCNLGGHGNLVLTDEIKEKIGNANRGRVINKEGRKRMSQAKLGDSSCAVNFGAYTNKGRKNPLSKTYIIKFPDGTIHTITGMRDFLRNHDVSSKLYQKGTCKGYTILKKFNDYSSGKYTQASGSAQHLNRGEDIV